MVFPVLFAGIVWLGLAGMMLGTWLALPSPSGVFSRDMWLGPVVGVALGGHCGLWAGAVYALSAPQKRKTLTTIAAGMANPLLYCVSDWFNGPMGPGWWLVNGACLVLPFLCGRLFACAMEGTLRLPLMPWARAALSTDFTKARHQRYAAIIVALLAGFGALTIFTVLVAWIGVLLPLSPSGIPGD